MTILSPQLSRFVSSPWVYDQVQHAVGLDRVLEHVKPYVSQWNGMVILDVGAGTGLIRSLLPVDSSYIWLDPDPKKLEGFQQRRATTDLALLNTGDKLALQAHSIDMTICTDVSHHLSEQQLGEMLSEVARVTRKKLLFLDAVKHHNSPASWGLWKLDRGSSPRLPNELFAAIEKHFEVEQIERFRVLHHYFMCIASPKPQGLP